MDFLHRSQRGTTAQNTSESEPLLMSFHWHMNWQTVKKRLHVVQQQFNHTGPAAIQDLPLRVNGGDGMQR